MASRNSQDYSMLESVASQSVTHHNSVLENLEMQVMIDDGKQTNFQRTDLEVDVPNQNSPQRSTLSDVQYHPSPQSRRKWLFYGGIVTFLVVVAAVLGGVFGSRANKKPSLLPFPSSNEITTGQKAMTTPTPTTTAASSVATVSTVSSSTTANQNNIDSKAYYRLTNSYLGASQSLDVVIATSRCRKLRMADSKNFIGQFWHFALLNNDINNPKYALRTQFCGEGFSLDVNVDINKGSLYLAATGKFSGQSWTVTPWEDKTESFRFTNDFTGPKFSLDTYSDTHEPFLDSGNHTGQHWRLEKTGDFLGWAWRTKGHIPYAITTRKTNVFCKWPDRKNEMQNQTECGCELTQDPLSSHSSHPSSPQLTQARPGSPQLHPYGAATHVNLRRRKFSMLPHWSRKRAPTQGIYRWFHEVLIANGIKKDFQSISLFCRVFLEF